ncbi:MAG TPA: 4'-phosphopantetheinyl transferase superfamily protein [Gemmatimonadales bacterium]|nr:4'-phosphopantetheinyl transferase superfamily protein [Gemmatimonadales bacterium]
MHSYSLALDVDRPLAASSLTAAERHACAALPTAERRAEWRAGRLAAKRAVARMLGLSDLRAIEVRSRPGTRPLVRLPRLSAVVPLTLSIAHAAGRAAAVVVQARGVGTDRVGVDLERAGTVRSAHARYFLGEAEQSLARRVDLTALWVLKEAAWKALGLRAETPFTALELHLGRDGQLAGLSLLGRRRPARAWLARPWPGFLLAVVTLPGGRA